MTQLSQAKYPSVKKYTMKARPTQLFCNISFGVWICSRPRKKRNVVRLINAKIVTLSCAMKEILVNDPSALIYGNYLSFSQLRKSQVHIQRDQ